MHINCLIQLFNLIIKIIKNPHCVILSERRYNVVIFVYSYSPKTDPTTKRYRTFSFQFTEREAHV